MAIFSDSLSVISSVSSPKPKDISSYYISQIRKRLPLAYNLGLKITLIWIPGHVNILGKKEADSLAKEACKKGLGSHIPMSYSDFFSLQTKKT